MRARAGAFFIWGGPTYDQRWGASKGLIANGYGGSSAPKRMKKKKATESQDPEVEKLRETEEDQCSYFQFTLIVSGEIKCFAEQCWVPPQRFVA